MTKQQIIELVEKLYEAKENCRTLLNEPNTTINFHDIEYFAKEVKRLRLELNKYL